MSCCKQFIKIDNITGEKLFTYGKAKSLNKKNDCEFFKKKFFSSEKDKKYCVDCKEWHVYSGGISG